MSWIIAICALAAAVCLGGLVAIYLRTVTRLGRLAREVDRRIVPYLKRQAGATDLTLPPPGTQRTPEEIVTEAAILAERLLARERKMEEIALGPTQNLPKMVE